MEHVVKILAIDKVTHDTKKFVVEKPKNYHFTSGQDTDIQLNKPEWKGKKRPFSFACLPEDKNLEFIIKCYPEHHSVTEQLHKLKVGDTIIIEEPFGTIQYKGKGVFIAGGAGITPFISILRYLKKENKIDNNILLFSNKTSSDIILEHELKEILKDNAIFTLTREKNKGYQHGRIDKDFLKKHILDFNQHFYICGPMLFIVEIKKALDDLGANTDRIVIEF